ncbi:hypothetical protein PG999_012066 [Apiospora kogelbergensis]|uniref:Uncharacterized protein n=1 Tax=Apiospora kogelbergensis TaxID=1337665 RepID=A0AAW0QGM7_9PEZI
MVAIRISNALRAARTAAPSATAATQSVVYRRSIATTPRVMAQGYGDGSKDPQGQPGASKAQEKSEHPGPSPPDVGKGTGGGPTKANESGGGGGGKSPEDASAQSGGARSKEAKETGSSPTGGSVGGQASNKGGEALKGPQGEGSPQPKILNQSMTPAAKSGLSEEQKREVEQHNVDFDKRHDRAASAADDKVDKKFWNS